jgi:hypothetical protein
MKASSSAVQMAAYTVLTVLKSPRNARVDRSGSRWRAFWHGFRNIVLGLMKDIRIVRGLGSPS